MVALESGAMTTVVMTLVPKFRLMRLEGVPEVTRLPFTRIVAPTKAAVGVTVRFVTAKGTVTE